TVAAHPLTLGAVHQQANDLRSQRLDITWVAEPPMLALDEGLGRAAGTRGHDRHAIRSCLQQNLRQPLPMGGQKEHVHGSHDVGDVPAPASQPDAAFKAGPPDRSYNAWTQLAISHPDETGSRYPCAHA